ncbi:MAG TPA: glycosyltransferase, partial [Gemmatimonadales bacterium]|nr:glycosyltransferase [Gemmatimonadales bacterium]
MTARPRLLFLGYTLPYPLDSGAAIRTFHLLRLLAREFDVTAVCFSRRKGGAVPQHDLPERLAAVRRVVELEAFPVPQEYSAGRLVWDHLCSVALHRAHTVFSFDSQAVVAHIRELLRTRRFDLIHVDSVFLSRYLPQFDGIPVVLGHQNVESELWRRRAAVEGAPWRRLYLRHQARLLAREERDWCPRCTLNLVVSEDDRLTLERRIPGASFAVVPNGVDLESFRPSPNGEARGLVFVGESTWFPNRDGLRYFCDAILPQVRAACGAVPLRWVGRAPELLRREFRDRYAVELTGYVPDVRPYVREAACYIVPLRVGGGTRLKILDAWAMGKAVVSTTVGCEGLAARDGENILIRDDPQSFAEAVRLVLQEPTLRARLGAEGRRTVERLYSWERIGDVLLRLYRPLARDRR